MYTATITNSSGQTLELTQKEGQYQVLNITGLNPPAAQVNTTALAGADGALFNSSKLGTRNITIMLRINGNVEANRLALYQYFRTKEPCRFAYKTGTRDVFIDGYVESLECDLFSNSETAMISIVCPYPYFKATQENSVTLNANTPTIINNASDASTGAIITLSLQTAFTELAVTNGTTNETMRLVGAYTDGSVITLNTNIGQKSISLTKDGVTTNIFSDLAVGSKFIRLASGDNSFSYETRPSVNLYVNAVVRYRQEYRGV